MSAWDVAKTGLKMMHNVIDGLEVIQSLTKIGGSDAAVALKAVDAVVKTLIDGFSGKTSPEGVRKEIESLDAQFKTLNESKLDKLRKKFEGEAP